MRYAGKPPFLNCIYLLLASATLVSAYGIAEHFGVDSSLWVQDVQTRVFSTLGQPNWLAAFLVTIIPFPIALALSKSTKKLRPVYYLLFAVYFLTILYTKSRSGALSLAITLAVFWLLISIKTKLKKFPYKPFAILTFAILALSLFDGLRWIPQINGLHLRLSGRSSEIIDLSQTQTPPDTPQILDGGSESSKIREVVWSGAIEVWRHYPLFGSGVETFAYSYYNFRPIEHNLLSEWDFLYNKAHNEYLNFLATTGSLGLGSYLLLQVWVFIWLLKQIFQKKLATSYYLLAIALLAGYVGLSVSNFFGFSTVIIGVLFFLYPAIAVVLSDKSKSHLPRATSHELNSRQYILITTVLLATFYLLLRIGFWWYADSQFSLGKKYLDAGFPEKAYASLERAVSVMPGEPTFHSEFSEAAANMAVFYAQNQKALNELEQSDDTTAPPEVVKFGEKALSEAEITRKLNPTHLNHVKNRARVMFTLAQLNPTLLTEAKNALLRGLELSPTDAKLMYNLALLYYQLEDDQKGLETLIKTIDLKPNYETARYSLGLIYEEAEELDKAREQYEYIINYISPQNTVIQDLLQNLPAN